MLDQGLALVPAQLPLELLPLLLQAPQGGQWRRPARPRDGPANARHRGPGNERGDGLHFVPKWP